MNSVYTALLTRSPRREKGRGAIDPRSAAGEEKLRSALEQLDRHKCLVLQGDPGSGKSTFVNFVALCLAGEILQHEQANLARLTAPLPDEEGDEGKEPQPWRYGALLPVPIVLRDFAATGLPERGEANVSHLWNFIETELEKALLADYATWLQKELRERGGLLLLISGAPRSRRRRWSKRPIFPCTSMNSPG